MPKNTNEKGKVSVRQYLIACGSGKIAGRKHCSLVST